PVSHLLEGLLAGQDLEPIDLAFTTGHFPNSGIEHPPRSAPDVGPSAVAFDKGNDGVVGHHPPTVAVLDALAHGQAVYTARAGVRQAKRRAYTWAMRGTPRLLLFTLAAVCSLAAGPGGATLQGTLACRHHATHQSHPGHGGAPADGPCCGGEIMGSAPLALSAAVPAPLPAAPAVAMPEQVLIDRALFPLPPSPSF